ncbi:MAG: hypothetical protein ACREMM_05435 [Gemmatimonadales bacterium]
MLARHITELELVRKFAKQVGAEGRGCSGVVGADDEVYQLTLLALGERRRVIKRILLNHRAAQRPSP